MDFVAVGSIFILQKHISCLIFNMPDESTCSELNGSKYDNTLYSGNS